MTITSILIMPIWEVTFTKTIDGSTATRTVISATVEEAERLFMREANDLYPDGYTIISITDTGKTVP